MDQKRFEIQNGTFKFDTVLASKDKSREYFSTSFKSIACFLFLFIITGIYLSNSSNWASKFNKSEIQYAVVLDAGSTSTKILAYKFRKLPTDHTMLLIDEMYKECKPGLLSYVNRPLNALESVQFLLNKAKAFIPPEQWSRTPLAMKARAGLFLSTQGKDDNILDFIRYFLLSSEFSVSDSSIEIIDSTDQAIFNWLTVNFLLENLAHNNTAAALNLGGHSTQVTFAVSDSDNILKSEDSIYEVKTTMNITKVFAQRYLGLGLQAVRHAILTKNSINTDKGIESFCIDSKVKNVTWIYNSVEYKVNGKRNRKSSKEFKICQDIIKDIVMSLLREKPPGLFKHKIAAFGYFYDKAVASNMIESSEERVTVGAYWRKSREVCKKPSAKDPFLCLDLTFISILLRDGFGLPSDKEIQLFKKIKGHQVSWPLGCAYLMLTNTEDYIA